MALVKSIYRKYSIKPPFYRVELTCAVGGGLLERGAYLRGGEGGLIEYLRYIDLTKAKSKALVPSGIL